MCSAHLVQRNAVSPQRRCGAQRPSVSAQSTDFYQNIAILIHDSKVFCSLRSFSCALAPMVRHLLVNGEVDEAFNHGILGIFHNGCVV